MFNRKSDTPLDATKYANIEQLRIIISIAIIATIIGVFGLDKEQHAFVAAARGFAVLPGTLLSLYLLFSAAHLKYNNSGSVGQLPVPQKLRRWCYNNGINLFWFMFMVFVLIVMAGQFGWDGNPDSLLGFWHSFFVSFGVLMIIIIMASIAAVREKKPSTNASKYKIFWRKR